MAMHREELQSRAPPICHRLQRCIDKKAASSRGHPLQDPPSLALISFVERGPFDIDDRPSAVAAASVGLPAGRLRLAPAPTPLLIRVRVGALPLPIGASPKTLSTILLLLLLLLLLGGPQHEPPGEPENDCRPDEQETPGQDLIGA